MSKSIGRVFLAAGLLAVWSMAAPVSAENAGTLARGGKLYDKWFKAIRTSVPTTAHRSYPAKGKYRGKRGADWRCKECHGWDYRGKDGIYAKGKHYTGIKGIWGARGADPVKIVAILRNRTHGYTDTMIGPKDMLALALFVSKGQIDMSKYVDAKTKKPNGDAARGKNYFMTICAQCHGPQGTKPREMGKTLGKQMGNPWEVMHKIQNGQPGEEMPALRALPVQITLDIMAFLGTLPKKKR